MLANAEILLSQYIDECRTRPFEWGQHDCLTFANNCALVQTGRAPLADMLGAYSSAAGAYRHIKASIKAMGYSNDITLDEVLDERLQRLNTRHPPRGAITAKRNTDEPVTGYMLGVALRDRSAFVGPDGLVFLSRSPLDLYWSVDQ